ncbi:TPA: VRR-NUC domain-containing protein [Enterobacter bugandensis]|nr:VRR-NUC domain-containing protein [Enterobacter bugandensis]
MEIRHDQPTAKTPWHLFYPTNDNPYPRVEILHQEDTATWLNHWHPEFRAFHVVNESGSKSDKKYGALLNRLGRRKGVTDWVIPYRFGQWPIAFVELKRDSRKAGRLSPEQKENLQHYADQGYFVAVCWGYDAFISCIAYLVKLNCAPS